MFFHTTLNMLWSQFLNLRSLCRDVLTLSNVTLRLGTITAYLPLIAPSISTMTVVLTPSILEASFVHVAITLPSTSFCRLFVAWTLMVTAN